MKKLIFAGATLLWAAGCTTPYLDRHMGEVKKSVEIAQLVNKEPRAARPASMVDGQISNAAQDRYHHSYGKPVQTNVYNIGVGSRQMSRP